MPSRPGTSSISLRVAIVAFAAVVVCGVIVAVVSNHPSAAFGWTAYTPLSEGPAFPGFTFLTRGELVGYAIAGVGIVGLVGCVGYVLGRRHHRDA